MKVDDLVLDGGELGIRALDERRDGDSGLADKELTKDPTRKDGVDLEACGLFHLDQLLPVVEDGRHVLRERELV